MYCGFILFSRLDDILHGCHVIVFISVAVDMCGCSSSQFLSCWWVTGKFHLL